MINQVSNTLIQRTNKLMTERYLSKKEMAERLGMEYLTFWRKLKGKRGIDVVLLMKIAQVLGTSVAYLLGETDNPVFKGTIDNPVVIQTNDPSRKIVSEPSRLVFHNGEVSIDIPDTPTNREWLEKFICNALQSNVHPQEISTAIA